MAGSIRQLRERIAQKRAEARARLAQIAYEREYSAWAEELEETEGRLEFAQAFVDASPSGLAQDVRSS